MAQKDNKKTVKKALVKSDSVTDKVGLEAQQLGDIRQLLFGQQMQEIQSSIELLGQNLTKEIDNLSIKMEKELGDFQHEVDENLKKIVENQQSDSFEHENREQSIETSIEEINKSFSDYQKSDKKNQQETEKLLRAEIEKLNKELESKHLETMDKIEQTANELKDNKADKNALASMLSNMAVNLQEQKD